MTGVPCVWKWIDNSLPFSAMSAPELTYISLHVTCKIIMACHEFCNVNAGFVPSAVDFT